MTYGRETRDTKKAVRERVKGILKENINYESRALLTRNIIKESKIGVL
jgi:hypothetical protein